METRGANVMRSNIAYFAFTFEQSLTDAPVDAPMVVALPDMFPLWIDNTQTALKLVDDLYEAMGAAPVYSMVTTLDNDSVSMYLDDKLLVTGECPQDLRDRVEQMIEAAKSRDERPRW